MTQPPYRPSEGHPMRRFALFSAALLVLIVVGSLPWKGGRFDKAMNKSMCVCVPTRVALMFKSMTTVPAVKTTQLPAKH
jgi:hypothetical protein